MNANPEGQVSPSEHKNAYMTSCPVVSRTHARISWRPNGDVVVTDSNSHHGTYINDSITRCTSGIAYTLNDGDTVSFGKGIFKDGKFHEPHSVLVRLNVGDLTPKSRTGTYGLKPIQRFTSVGSQSEVQAEKIRSEVQRLGRRKDVASKQKRQLQDVASRLDYLEKKALEKTTSPQEIELRLMALERHYEGLLEKLTVIEHNLVRPQADDESDDYEPRRRRRGQRAVSEEGDDTDDDEAAVRAASRSSKPSMTTTMAMVVAGGVAVWTALALS